MAKYTKKFVDPYPSTGFMDLPNKVSSIKATILNNWVVVFKSVEQWLYDHDIITIEPNPEITGATPETLETILIDDTLYKLSTGLGDLTNVVILNPQNRQALVYDSTTQKWVNGDSSTVGSLSDLSDVDLSQLQDYEVLAYDTVEEKWINLKLPISALGDISFPTEPTDGQVLVYDSTLEKWTNGDGGGTDVFVTKAQYDALPSSKTSDGKHYFITDWVDTSVASANQISYDNTSSSMSATNLQSALDELVSMI